MSGLPDIDTLNTQTGNSRFAWIASRRTHNMFRLSGRH